MSDHTFPAGETPATVMARIEASATLLLTSCPHCADTRSVIGITGELPRAVSVRHQPHCPDWVPE